MSLDMEDIHVCVICGKNLKPVRDHVDTCRGSCYQRLLKRQRTQNASIEARDADITGEDATDANPQAEEAHRMSEAQRVK